MVFVYSSCVKDRFNDIEIGYQGTVALPIATVGFTLAEVLQDDTLLTVGSDNAISLVYRQDNFFTISAAELLEELTDDLVESFSQTTKLGPVALGDMTEQFDMPFSDLVEDFSDQNIRQTLEQNQGNMIPVPPFHEDFTSDLPVPEFEDFTYLEIKSARMVLSIKNELFVDLQNFIITVVDTDSGLSLGTFNFSTLPMGTTQSEEIILDGKSFGNNLKVIVTSLETNGSNGNPVLIDLGKKLIYTLDVKDITIKAGEAVLDPGVLAQDSLEFDFSMENNEQIHRIVVNDVDMAYSIFSEVKTAVRLKLTFPNIYKNNNPVVQTITLTPGAPVAGTIDLSNTTWRLDQHPGQSFNRMRVDYEVELESASSSPVQFSSEDEVSIDFTISGLDLAEATGYLGFREETFDDGDLDLGFDFSLFDSGSSPLLFENPKMRIEVANSFGIPLKVNFNATAQGAFGGQASLDPPALTINYPGINEAGTTKMTEFLISKNNSKIVDLLSVYPASITYGGHATINPDNDPQIINFIRATSELTASAEIDLPFSFRVEDLVYRDTGEAVSLGLEEGLTIDDIELAELKILYTNGMPLKTTLRILALAADGSETVILDDVAIDAAAVNASGKVTAGGKASGELFASMTSDQIRKLDEAVQNIYEIRFQTGNDGQAPAAMFTDYDVELKIGMTIKFDK